MIPPTSQPAAMKTGQSTTKPVFKRSASLGFTPSSGTDKVGERRNRNSGRYAPYSVVTRRSLLLRSNSQQNIRQDNKTRTNVKDTKRRNSNKTKSTTKRSYDFLDNKNRQRKSKKNKNNNNNNNDDAMNKNKSLSFNSSASSEDTLYDRLIKENNLSDMASRLQDSLTIDGREKSTSTTSSASPSSSTTTSATTAGRNDLGHDVMAGGNKCRVPTNGREESEHETRHVDARDTTSSYEEDIILNKENNKPLEQIADSDGSCSTDDACNNFFLPSFHDEFSFSSLLCQNVPTVKETDDRTTCSLKEITPTRKSQIRGGSKHKKFLDGETVTQVLRKADTVLLFDDDDDKEDDVTDDDFDFSLPIQFSSPRHHSSTVPSSCEGNKAKLSWNKLFNEQYACAAETLANNNDSSSDDFDNDSLDSSDNEEAFDLEDWIHCNPVLTPTCKLLTTGYDDLSRMQGTYTCSICSTNLEVDPFASTQRRSHDPMFSLTSFNGSSIPRSHDCDVTLFCPSCCSDRVVFHANRL